MGSVTKTWSRTWLLCLIMALALLPLCSAFRGGLRGGGDDAAAAEANNYAKEQLDYWNGLTKEQQQELLAGMTPEERANTEAFVSGKPMKMTISKESLAAWNAMSKAEQDAQLALMSPEQKQAIHDAVSGAREAIDLSHEVKK